MHNVIVTRFEHRVVNLCIDICSYIYCKVIEEGYMKNHSRVFSTLSLENINKVKLTSEASQEKLANIEIRTLGLLKVGVQTHL